MLGTESRRSAALKSQNSHGNQPVGGSSSRAPNIFGDIFSDGEALDRHSSSMLDASAGDGLSLLREVYGDDFPGLQQQDYNQVSAVCRMCRREYLDSS